MITISREGRRFDVYYNDQLVFSQKTMYMPVNTPSNTNLSGVHSGHSALTGQMALIDLMDTASYAADVQKAYTDKADTRGTPYVGSEATSLNQVDPAGMIPTYSPSLWSFSNMFSGFSLCPEGGCMRPPAIRSSGLYEVSTSY